MKKKTKFYLSFICFFVVLFLATIAALPTWISTSFGTKCALHWINHSLKTATLSVDKIELRWFGPQRFNGVQYKNAENQLLFSCQKCETETSLFHLIFESRTFGTTLIDTPYLFFSDQEVQTAKGAKKEAISSSKKKTKLGFPLFKDSLQITKGTLVFSPEKDLPPLKLENIFLEKKPSPDRLSLKAKTLQGETEGTIQIEATWKQGLHAEIHIQDFPVALLDSFYRSKLYTEALGSTLNLDLHLEKKEQEPLVIQGAAKSATMSLSLEGSTNNNTFSLNPNSYVSFTMTPALFKQLVHEHQRSSWELARNTQLNLQIEEASFSPNEFTIQAKAQLERAELHHSSLGSYSLNHFNLALSADQKIECQWYGEIQGKEATKAEGSFSFSPEGELQFDYACKDFPVTLLSLAFEDLEEKVRTTLGGHLNLKGKGLYRTNFLDTQMTVESPNTALQAHLSGPLSGFHFDLSGDHHLYGSKSKIVGDSVHLVCDGEAHLKQGSFALPHLKGVLSSALMEMEFNGQVGEIGQPFSLDQIELVASGKIKEYGTLFFHVDGANNTISGKAESKALDLQFELLDFIQNGKAAFDKSSIDFSCALSDFPTASLSPLLNDSLDLATFFGPTLNLSSQGRYTPNEDPHLNLELSAQSDGFRASMNVAVDSSLKIRQNTPSSIYWEMTPKRYRALMDFFPVDHTSEPTFMLTHPVNIALNIEQFSCPTLPTKNFGRFLCQSGFIGDLYIDTMEFKSRQTHEIFLFQGITGSIKGKNFSKAIDLALAGKILSPNIAHAPTSTFNFSGQMLNFWTEKDKFNKEGLTLKGELNLALLPVRQIAGIAPLNHETRSIVQALLGDLINARISGEISQLSGPVTVDLKSSNLKALLPLELKKTAFYLRDYVNAEITLTQDVNETFLKDINPIIFAGAFSDHPLKIYIDPNGFFLPIHPFSLDKIDIGKAVVDIGKIKIKNGGQIQSLMQFLNAKELSSDGLMEAWFTPIFLQLHKGVATYKRFDALLAQNVHIALWGGVHLVNDSVNMTLAIAPKTLYDRFKISGLNNNMFQIKMGGTTSNLKLDWSSAQTRIAWIIARSSVGLISDILGGVLEQLLSHLGEDSVPPATTDPFPWTK